MANTPRETIDYSSRNEINNQMQLDAKNIFNSTLIEVDFGMQKIEPQNRETQFLGGLYNFFVKLEKNPENPSEEWKKRFDEFYTIFFQKFGTQNIDVQNIVSTKISSDGFIHIKDGNQKNFSLNIVDEWNILGMSSAERTIREQTREKEKKLQNEVAKEAFLGGNIVLEYVKDQAATLGLGVMAISAFVVRTPEGQRRIELKKPFRVMKESLSETILPLAKKAGYIFDFKEKKFFNLNNRAIKDSLEILRKMTFAEYQKQPNADKNIKTEAEFEKMKAETLLKVEKEFSLLRAGKGLAKNFFKNFAHDIIWMPIFMTEFRKHQTPANALAGLGEMGAFTAGAMLGSKVAKGPILWKMAAPMIGGGLAVMGGQKLMQEMEANRKKWEYTTKSNYNTTHSKVLHFASGMFLPEVLDSVNNFTKKHFDTQFDLGIARAHVNLPGESMDFTIPEINWATNRVTLGTSPVAWMSESMGRSVEDWNEGVNRYKIEATKLIHETLKKYHKNMGVFANESDIKKAGDKKSLLRRELAEILLGGNDGKNFLTEINNIVEGVASEADTLSASNPTNSMINEIISYNIDAMKINKNYIADRENTLSYAEKFLQPSLLGLTTDASKQQYLSSLYGRMLRDEDLYASDTEKSMYMSLITDKTRVQTSAQEDITVGVYFANLLDTMAEHRIERKFLDNLKSGRNKPVDYQSY